MTCEWFIGGMCLKDDDCCDGNCDGHMFESDECESVEVDNCDIT